MKAAIVLLILLLAPHAVPSINVLMTADKATVFVGDSITLTLNVTNTLDETIYNVTVYRSVPSGFELSTNESRIPFKASLKPNESAIFKIELIAVKAGKLAIEPAIVKYVYKGKEYLASSNRVYITVYDQTQKELENATSKAVKYAAISAGLVSLTLLAALIVRRPRKPRSI